MDGQDRATGKMESRRVVARGMWLWDDENNRPRARQQDYDQHLLHGNPANHHNLI